MNAFPQRSGWLVYSCDLSQQPVGAGSDVAGSHLRQPVAGTCGAHVQDTLCASNAQIRIGKSGPGELARIRRVPSPAAFPVLLYAASSSLLKPSMRHLGTWPRNITAPGVQVRNLLALYRRLKFKTASTKSHSAPRFRLE